MIQDKANSPIFITGCERSGSTIIARIVSHCGTFTGRTTEMLENIEIKKLTDTYYDLIGADKKGQNPLPDTKKLIIPTNWKQKIEDVLTDEKYDNSTWMIKGSRLCQTWPVWHYAFPNAKWVIVRRRTGDIIDSCLKTGYMTAYKDKEGWLGWVHEHEKLFVEMIEAGVNCKIVWPERMATGDYGQIFEMLDWVGLPWNNDIVQIVEPLLWNSRQRKKGV
jgi:hypothetical protein